MEALGNATADDVHLAQVIEAGVTDGINTIPEGES